MAELCAALPNYQREEMKILINNNSLPRVVIEPTTVSFTITRLWHCATTAPTTPQAANPSDPNEASRSSLKFLYSIIKQHIIAQYVRSVCTVDFKELVVKINQIIISFFQQCHCDAGCDNRTSIFNTIFIFCLI